MRDWESLDFHLHYIADLKLFQFLSVESGFRVVSLAPVSLCLEQTLDPVYPPLLAQARLVIITGTVSLSCMCLKSAIVISKLV